MEWWDAQPPGEDTMGDTPEPQEQLDDDPTEGPDVEQQGPLPPDAPEIDQDEPHEPLVD